MKVRDLHNRRGVMTFRIHGKRDKIRYVEAAPGTLELIHDYLEAVGHGGHERPGERSRHRGSPRMAWAYQHCDDPALRPPPQTARRQPHLQNHLLIKRDYAPILAFMATHLRSL